MKHIIITGGHHNSALVVARELKKRGHKVSWIGHLHTAKGDTAYSAEYSEVSSSHIPFYALQAGKLGGSAGLGNLYEIPLGLLRALRLIHFLKPSAILSFGGYLGASTGLAGVLLGKPLYLHEQTVVAGKANKFLSRFASQVFLTWPSSSQFFPARKSITVGLPLRPSLLTPSRISYFDNDLPTIVALGGKQGSHALNVSLEKHLPQILANYNLIHQTGASTVTRDFERAVKNRHHLSKNLARRYLVHSYIGEEEIGTVLASSDIYVGRSGAHITYELGLLGLPSILVPYLYTHEKEQLQNARYLSQAGLGQILLESDLTWDSLEPMLKRASQFTKKPLALPRNATTRLVDFLLKDLLEKGRKQ